MVAGFVMLYVRVLCGTVDQGREEFANQLVHFAFFGGGRNIILVFVQICALIFAIKITKAIRKRRTDMTLDMKKIAERKLGVARRNGKWRQYHQMSSRPDSTLSFDFSADPYSL
mgnify:CR=1 FL=1